jgi:HAD superfamily hydrolase (TIGR01549 family)
VDTRGVLFDFGGTLDSEGVPWGVRFHRIYARAGGRLAWVPFEAEFQASGRELEVAPEIRRAGLHDMIVRQSRILGGRLKERLSISDDELGEQFYLETVAGVDRNRALLQELRSRYALGVVSNFTGNLDICLKELALLSCFTVVLDSTLVGRAKPDAEIFHMALRALNMAPEHVWMIGDNFEFDIRPATSLGIRTCWLAPPERIAPSDGPATARIERLAQFPGCMR